MATTRSTSKEPSISCGRSCEIRSSPVTRAGPHSFAPAATTYGEPMQADAEFLGLVAEPEPGRFRFTVENHLARRDGRLYGGTAIAVRDADMVTGMRELGGREGISAAPEGGASLEALKQLLRDGVVRRDQSVVLFNTGGALKYLDVLAP